MIQEWRDLGDDELVSRLVLRGVPIGHARRAVRRRDHPSEAGEIDQLLAAKR